MTMVRQNHSTSPSATPPLVSHAVLAHDFRRPAITLRTPQRRVNSPPRLRDDRDTPLSVGRDAEIKPQNSEKRKRNIFRKGAGQVESSWNGLRHRWRRIACDAIRVADAGQSKAGPAPASKKYRKQPHAK
jgi:hypothetical protein